MNREFRTFFMTAREASVVVFFFGGAVAIDRQGTTERVGKKSATGSFMREEKLIFPKIPEGSRLLPPLNVTKSLFCYVEGGCK